MSERRRSSKDRKLGKVLVRATLLSMAGERSFGRGQEYFKEGRVGPLVMVGNGVAASVHGTSKYKVRLLAKAGVIDHYCSCPAAADGSFCKHCVAVGLAVLSEGPVKRMKGITDKEVRAFLMGKSSDELASMIMEYAAADERLWGRLHMDVARQSQDGPDIATFRNIIDLAVETDGFVDYRSCFEYARGIEEVVDQLENILEHGTAAHAKGVIELSEYAIGALGEAINSVDDSSGAVGSVLDRLGDLHLKACSKARPDPIGLAERLFELELNFEHDTFYGAAERYKRVLGKAGTAHYRELAEALWKEVPQLDPGDDTRERYGSRSRITHMMLALAGLSGDVEEVVSVLSRDLSFPYCFLQIATAYKDAGKHDSAIDWAQRGIDEFPGKLDGRLTDFLAEEFDGQGLPGDATEMVWKGFEHRPDVAGYAKLKKYATKAGEWENWRKMAIEHVQKLSKDGSSRKDARPVHQDLLVEIFMWEKDIETAWLTARSGGCSEEIWMGLARLREKDHPEDAVPIYKRQVERLILLKPGGKYDDAIKMLQRIREIMMRMGQGREFADYVQAIKKEHGLKRSLMRLLVEKIRP